MCQLKYRNSKQWQRRNTTALLPYHIIITDKNESIVLDYNYTLRIRRQSVGPSCFDAELSDIRIERRPRQQATRSY